MMDTQDDDFGLDGMDTQTDAGGGIFDLGTGISEVNKGQEAPQSVTDANDAGSTVAPGSPRSVGTWTAALSDKDKVWAASLEGPPKPRLLQRLTDVVIDNPSAPLSSRLESSYEGGCQQSRCCPCPTGASRLVQRCFKELSVDSITVRQLVAQT